MKKSIYSSLLFLMIILSSNLKAQTDVTTTSAYDYSYSTCPLPAMIYGNLYGTATNYNPATDSITIQVFWGDGSDSTYKVGLIDQPGITDNFDADSMVNVQHSYYLAGTYAPMFIATGPDGSDDTIIGNAITFFNGCAPVDGYLYADNNSNCIFDSGDDTLAGKLVLIHGPASTLLYSGYTNSLGYYSINVATGLTGLSISPSTVAYSSVVCPAAGSYTFNSTGAMTFNFAINCTAPTSYDFYASHSGMCGIGPPGGYGEMAISAGALGCSSSTPATITLTTDPLVTYVNMNYGPAPTSVVGNVLTWNITLAGYTGWGSGFNVSLNTYTSTTAIVGTPSCWDIDISSPLADPNPTNNHEHHCLTVDGPWDPNAKEVVPAGVGPTGDVLPDTEFYYTLYFQNTGTAPAINIYVMDTISNNLDMSTFQITGSSHLMNPIFTNADIIRFDFPNINLPDSNANEPMSHGWVKYRIKTKSGLIDGTQIKNTGHIFFDYNSAIVTNTTLNTINSFIGIHEISAAMENTIFPNPATNTVTVHFNEVVKGTLFIVDITGKKVKQINVNNTTQIQISLNDVSAGIYGLTMSGVQLKQNRLQVIK